LESAFLYFFIRLEDAFGLQPKERIDRSTFGNDRCAAVIFVSLYIDYLILQVCDIGADLVRERTNLIPVIEGQLNTLI